MKLEDWDLEKHLPLIREWLVARGQATDTGTSDLYPPTGLVAGNIAIAFLYMTNAPGVAYLDGLITDPNANIDTRRKAVDYLCKSLVEKADKAGIKVIWCLSPVTNLANILKDSDFQLLDTGYDCFVRSKVG